MGKAADAAVTVFVVIIGLFVLERLGITLPVVEQLIRHFLGA